MTRNEPKKTAPRLVKVPLPTNISVLSDFLDQKDTEIARLKNELRESKAINTRLGNQNQRDQLNAARQRREFREGSQDQINSLTTDLEALRDHFGQVLVQLGTTDNQLTEALRLKTDLEVSLRQVLSDLGLEQVAHSSARDSVADLRRKIDELTKDYGDQIIGLEQDKRDLETSLVAQRRARQKLDLRLKKIPSQNLAVTVPALAKEETRKIRGRGLFRLKK